MLIAKRDELRAKLLGVLAETAVLAGRPCDATLDITEEPNPKVPYAGPDLNVTRITFSVVLAPGKTYADIVEEGNRKKLPDYKSAE